jgi:hypothetical protein
MTFIAVFTTTKPSEAIFFKKVSDENARTVDFINSWTADQPGFVSQEGYAIDTNTKVHNITWETQEDYMNWRANRAKLPQQIERAEYSNANNITTEIATSAL